MRFIQQRGLRCSHSWYRAVHELSSANPGLRVQSTALSISLVSVCCCFLFRFCGLDCVTHETCTLNVFFQGTGACGIAGCQPILGPHREAFYAQHGLEEEEHDRLRCEVDQVRFAVHEDAWFCRHFKTQPDASTNKSACFVGFKSFP